MCSGRVDLEFILRAFSNGADGVFIGGCRLGECNYTTHGNFHALNMVQLCKRILEHAGLDPDRLRIAFMSSGEGNLFTEAVDVFTRRVRELGPLASDGGLGFEEIRARLGRVSRLVPYIKMVKEKKLAQRLDPADVQDFYTLEEIGELFDQVIAYHIDPEKCQACGICARRCPVEAIDGGKGLIHVIDQNKCIKCGSCLEACPPRFGAVRKLLEVEVPDPVPEEKRAVVKEKKKAAG